MKNLIFILLSLLAFSCNQDVLNKVPLDIISDNSVWQDQNLIDAYLTETYSEMYVFTNEIGGSGGEGWTIWSDINGISDECRSEYASNVFGFKNGGLKIEGGLLEWWENSYSVIRKLNVFIKKIQTSPVAEDFKTRRVAEARFLRAFSYFSMVKRYGGVPLIKEAQDVTNPVDSLYPKRAKEQQIYDFVISEMEGIANDLPEIASANDFGRASKYAALALESRAALYAASIAKFGTVQLDGVIGIPASSAQAYYQKAFDVSKTIITSGKYALYNKNSDKAMNFRQIFLDKNNVEVIFVRPHTFSDKNAGGNGWSYDFFQCPCPNAWGGGNQDGPYVELVEEFENRDGSSGKLDRTAVQQGVWTTDQLWGNKDPRFFGTIYTHNTPWKGALVDFHAGILLPDGSIQNDGSYNGLLASGSSLAWSSVTGFGVMKYLDENHNNQGPWVASGTDWVIFRYGEILLNYAEAADELGNTQEALSAINEIRTRAGIANLTDVDRDKIRHERRVELAFEGHRYWDLRRWRTAVSDLTKDFTGLRYVLDPVSGKYKILILNPIDGVNGPTFFTQNYYLPITIGRTANNPNLVENPGYN